MVGVGGERDLARINIEVGLEVGVRKRRGGSRGKYCSGSLRQALIRRW